MSRLDEIQARVDAATPGPWVWNDERDLVSDSAWTESYFGSPSYPVRIICTDGGHYPPEEQDRPFIVHAREDVPYLLARVRELEEAVMMYAKAENWAIHDDISNGGANVWAPDGRYDPTNENGFDLARAALAGERDAVS